MVGIGSAAIVLKDAGDQETFTKVKQLLTDLAADPANGIAAVLDKKAIDEMGGSPRGSLLGGYETRAFPSGRR